MAARGLPQEFLPMLVVDPPLAVKDFLDFYFNLKECKDTNLSDIYNT